MTTVDNAEGYTAAILHPTLVDPIAQQQVPNLEEARDWLQNTLNGLEEDDATTIFTAAIVDNIDDRTIDAADGTASELRHSIAQPHSDQ